jgi:Tfp pilus assembly protein PilN
MRAVNLIPAEEATRGGGRSGLGVYALLGALAVLVAMSALYALAGRSVHDKRGELAAVTAQADATEAKASSLKTYAQFSDVRKARVETVQSLLDSRFDWAPALREVARTLPSGTWMTAMRATVTPNVGVDGTADPLRSAIAVPAIEAGGCATGQSGVARTLVALRGMAGVQRVSLSNSTKAADAPGGTTDSAQSAGGDGCGSRLKFSLTIFFEAPAAPTASSTTAAATGGKTP